VGSKVIEPGVRKLPDAYGQEVVCSLKCKNQQRKNHAHFNQVKYQKTDLKLKQLMVLLITKQQIADTTGSLLSVPDCLKWSRILASWVAVVKIPCKRWYSVHLNMPGWLPC